MADQKHEFLCLNKKYSTTRLVTHKKPTDFQGDDDKIKTMLYLPPGAGRKDEGGLRTQGYFKAGGIASSYTEASSTDFELSSHFEKDKEHDSEIKDLTSKIQYSKYRNQSLISVVTVVYNSDRFLEETILSVISQTYDNVEYIVIDGGSTDGTLNIIHKYSQAIDYWVSEKDSGVYDAMNKGIRLATGKWINFMNSGDTYYSPEVISRVYHKEIPIETQVIYGHVETDYGAFRTVQIAGSLGRLPYAMQFSHQSTFFELIFHKKNNYNNAYELASDYFVILHAYLQYPDSFLKVDFPIARVNADGLSEENSYRSVKERFKIINDSGQGRLKLTCFYLFKYSTQFIKSRFLGRKALNSYRMLKVTIKTISRIKL